MNAEDITGPHRTVPARTARERFLCDLFDVLWSRYRERVSYVRTYEEVVRSAGATFVNDHIAFRTFGVQRPLIGIASLSRVFEALGYAAANCYQFDDKHLSAIHFQHPLGELPKLFISELRTWELIRSAREIVLRSVGEHRAALPDDTLAALRALDEDESPRDELLQTVVNWIHELPWPRPEKNDVTTLNAASQYGAWVLVHGYNVNHFTSLINSHAVEPLSDIERTIAVLQAAGVPMKKEIEGERGTKLRQTSTEAVTIPVDVLDGGQPAQMPWTYAYFELAERGEIVDPETGRRGRFEGFLGPQATNLFEMTRTK